MQRVFPPGLHPISLPWLPGNSSRTTEYIQHPLPNPRLLGYWKTVHLKALSNLIYADSLIVNQNISGSSHIAMIFDYVNAFRKHHCFVQNHHFTGWNPDGCLNIHIVYMNSWILPMNWIILKHIHTSNLKFFPIEWIPVSDWVIPRRIQHLCHDLATRPQCLLDGNTMESRATPLVPLRQIGL